MRWRSSQGLAVVALGLFGAVLPYVDVAWIETTTVVLVTLATLAVVGAWLSRPLLPPFSTRTVAFGGLFVSLMMMALGSVVAPSQAAALSRVLLLVLSVLIVLRHLTSSEDASPSGSPLFRFGITTLLASTVVVIGVFGIAGPQPVIDVLDMHVGAAATISNGGNPYTDFEVRNTNPYLSDESVFVGYVYAPLALVFFVGAEWLGGDARWASILAAMAFVILLVRPWRAASAEVAAARAALALVFVSLPYLSPMIHLGWTDLLALPFLAAAGMLWTRHPAIAALALGLAFSSKAYFLLALPIIIFLPDEYRWKRVAIVTAAIVATHAPFAAVDVAAISNQIGGAASAQYRPDSLGLAGIGVNVPRSLSLGLAAAVGVVAGLRATDLRRFYLGIAATLAIAFVTGFQAFINYWILVVGVVLIALVSATHERTTSPVHRTPAARSLRE